MDWAFHPLIPALWAIWLLYWIVAARSAKATRRHEDTPSRLSHHVPLIAGAGLLGIPNILGPALEEAFLPPSPAWHGIGATLVAIGLGFAAAARSEQFGDAYARYRSEVPALIPFIV